MDSSVSPKDEVWFLRVYHHISNAVYACVMSDTQTRDTANGTARSNKSFPQYSEGKLFFVQAERS